MIYFDNVTKIYPPNIIALDNVSLSISQGEFVSIVGRSGAGKSTLLKLIFGEEKPTKGKIYFENKNLVDLAKKSLPFLRRKISMIYQDFKLLDQKTVYENVAFGMEVTGASDREIQKTIPQVLKLVKLEKKENFFPHQLSAGEQQRVAVARALALRPKVILADEPTGNLDLYNTKELIKLFLKINEHGTTIILATHNKDVVNYIKKRVIVLNKGKIVKDMERGKYIL